MKFSEYLDQYLNRNISYLISTLIGLIIGTLFKKHAHILGAIGRTFLNILLVTITPFLACLFINSIVDVRKMQLNLNYMRLTSVFFAMLFLSCSIGLCTSLILQPGFNFSLSNADNLKSILDLAAQHTISITTPIETNISNGVLKIISQAIPTNIYQAFQHNVSFQITVFSIIFGISIGSDPDKLSGLLAVLNELQKVLEKIVKKIVHYLPLIIIFLSAEQFALTGAENLISMLDFAVKFFVAGLIFLSVTVFIIKLQTKISFIELWQIMLQPTIVTVCSQTPYPAIPATIISLRRLGYNKTHLNMLVPFGTTFAKYDNAIYMGFCTIFALQVYGFEYNAVDYLAIIGFICIVSLSTAGQGNRSAVTELPIILKTLAVPSSALLPLILALEFIMSPFRLILTLYANCAAIALMDTPSGNILALEEIQMEDDNSK